MTATNAEHTRSATTQVFTGRVKWFNNKAGYGFITITDGEKNGTDVFVHHSHINVDKEQYKYLVQGEYVDFQLLKMDSGNHEYQAAKVSGIRNGQLMCETRHQMNTQRMTYKQQKSQVPEPKAVATASASAPQKKLTRADYPLSAKNAVPDIYMEPYLSANLASKQNKNLQIRSQSKPRVKPATRPSK